MVCIRELGVNIFENGLENSNVTGISILNIMQGIKDCKNSHYIKKLFLDFGRIGCTKYSTLNIIKKNHVEAIT